MRKIEIQEIRTGDVEGFTVRVAVPGELPSHVAFRHEADVDIFIRILKGNPFDSHVHNVAMLRFVRCIIDLPGLGSQERLSRIFHALTGNEYV